MAAGSVPEGAQALAEGIRRDIALGLCAVGIVMAEADHQQITGADMRGNVVQPPLLAEGLAAAARHGAVVNDKARQLVAHLLREGAVRAVGSLTYSITVRQRVEHLAPACHRLIAGGVALHDGITRHPEGRLGVQLRQHIGKIHVVRIVKGRVARLVVAVVLPCHATAVLCIVHQGKQLVGVRSVVV